MKKRKMQLQPQELFDESNHARMAELEEANIRLEEENKQMKDNLGVKFCHKLYKQR